MSGNTWNIEQMPKLIPGNLKSVNTIWNNKGFKCVFLINHLSMFNCKQYTWALLPYIAVEKSGHKTATVCSFVNTFLCGSKLLTVAVLWPVNKTANGGSFVASFRSLWPMCQQNCKPWQFYGHFSEFIEYSVHQNCKPWQFYGHFLESTSKWP